LALTLSRTAQERMGQVQQELAQYLANWHFIPQVNFHVTLRFFGETPEAEIARISGTCCELAPGYQPLRLRWSDVGFFGPPHSARVLFIGAEESPELRSLAEAITAAFPDERERRKYRPHVTLAKARKHMEPGLARMNANMLRRLQELGRIGPEPVMVDLTTVHREFVLMETEWVGRAVEYKVRERYPLMLEEE
jgi:2'-5' RNA ligase